MDYYPLRKVTVFNEMVPSYGSYVKYSDPGVLETKQTELNISYYLLEPEEGREGNSYEITGITGNRGELVRHEENMNDDLTKITEWLTANNLTLNKSKTEFVLIGSRLGLNTFNRFPSFTIDSNSIKQSEVTKFLGVYIDQNLTWNVQIEHISKKKMLPALAS